MATITSTDNLFASATIRGVEFFSYAGSGISCLSELIRRVRQQAVNAHGMVTLNVRNASQGWAQTRDFYLGF